MMNKLPAKQRLAVDMEIMVNDRSVFSTKEGPNWVPGLVEDLLSEQFVAHVIDGGQVRHYFYRDEGNSWRMME
jgi:hypothetical protein